MAIAERLNKRSWRLGARPGVSCGCASAVITTAGATLAPSQLFVAADKARYQAKHARTAMLTDVSRSVG